MYICSFLYQEQYFYRNWLWITWRLSYKINTGTAYFSSASGFHRGFWCELSIPCDLLGFSDKKCLINHIFLRTPLSLFYRYNFNTYRDLFINSLNFLMFDLHLSGGPLDMNVCDEVSQWPTVDWIIPSINKHTSRVK